MNAITFEEKYNLRELTLLAQVSEGPEFAPEHTESLGPVTICIVRQRETSEFFLNVFFKDEAKSRTYGAPREMNPTSILTANWLYQNRYLPVVHHLTAGDVAFINAKFHTMQAVHDITVAARNYVTLADNWKNLLDALAIHRNQLAQVITEGGHSMDPEQDALYHDCATIIKDMNAMMLHRQVAASLTSDEKHYLDTTIHKAGRHAIAYIEQIECFGANVDELRTVMEEAGRRHLASLKRGRQL